MLEKTSFISFKSNNCTKLHATTISRPVATDCFVNSRADKSSKQNHSLLSFTGLTRAISQRLFDQSKEVSQLDSKYPKANGIVGNLPASWINKIPEQNRKEKIKDIYTAFKDATLTLRKSLYSIDKRSSIDSASNAIKTSLISAGIIGQNDDIQLKALKAGHYGTGYSLTVANEKFLFKVFHEQDNKKEVYHGPCIETNRAAFIDHNGRDKNYSRFYFGDIQSGFDLFQFIDSSLPQPIKIIDEQGLGCSYGDDGEEKIGLNIINNYFVDYGGISIKNKILSGNKTARWVYKKLTAKTRSDKLHENWDRLYRLASDNHIPNRNDILLGLIACIEFLPDQHKSQRLISLAETENLNDATRIAILSYFKDNSILNYADKLHIFTVLSANSSKDTKKELVSRLDTLDKKDQLTVFNLLARSADSEIKLLLTDRIPYLPSENIATAIKTLAEGSDQKLKEALYRNIYSVHDPEQYVEALKLILNGASDKVKSDIADRAGVTRNLEAFRLIAQNSNDEIKTVLADQIRYFSGIDARDAFLILADKASKELKEVLHSRIRYLDEEYKAEALKRLG